METILIDKIKTSLSVIAAPEYSYFLDLHEKKEYRRAYLVLIELLNKTEVTEEKTKLLEQYWWEYAN